MKNNIIDFLSNYNHCLKNLFDVCGINYNGLAYNQQKKMMDFLMDYIGLSLLIITQGIDSYIKSYLKISDYHIAYSFNYYSSTEKQIRIKINYTDKNNENQVLRTYSFNKEIPDIRKISKELENMATNNKGSDLFNEFKNNYINENFINDDPYVILLNIFYELNENIDNKSRDNENIHKPFSMMKYFEEHGNNNPIVCFLKKEKGKGKDNILFTDKHKKLALCSVEDLEKHLNITENTVYNYDYYFDYLNIAINFIKLDETKYEKLINDVSMTKIGEYFTCWEKYKISYNQYNICINDSFTNETRGNIVIFFDKQFDNEDIKRIKFIGDYYISILSELEFRYLKALKATELRISSLKTAIISILVDSFAHNVSAHSLAALKWWLESRTVNIYDKKIVLKEVNENDTLITLNNLQQLQSNILINDQNYDHEKENKESQNTLNYYANKSDEYYKILGLGDSSNDKYHTSLLEIIQFMDDDLQNKILAYKPTFTGYNMEKEIGNIRYPVPIDHAMWKFMRFMRDKAAFWSGVTRDLPFGGEVKNLYTILWNDFADNPLYLGTIAHSEGIQKVNIHIEIPQANNLTKTEFAKIDMSVIEYEKQIADGISPSLDENSDYSKYMLVYPGDGHKEIREELQKGEYDIFLPGGIVGEHALFTLFENTLRNVKHLKITNDMKEKGLNLKIKIEPARLKNKDEVKLGSKEHKLFKFEVWLDHDNKLMVKDKDGKPIVEILRDSTKDSIVNENGGPRLGGNSQDKICAAMLFNNRFISVEPGLRKELTERDKYYYNEEKGFYWIGFNEEGKKETDNVNDNKGKISKYFYLWKGEFIKTVKSEEDFKDENISRFKFVYIDNKENKESLYRKARENGIIRIIRSSKIGDPLKKEIKSLDSKSNTDTINNIKKNIYDFWLDEFCFKEEIIVAGKSGENYKSFEELNRDRGINISDNYIVSCNRIRKIDEEKDDNCNKILSFAHGDNKDPENVLDFRSHGKLVEYFYKTEDETNNNLLGKRYIKNFRGKPPINTEVRSSELVEILLTKIYIFDNRIYNRIPENKMKLYKDKLNVIFSAEKSSFDETDKSQSKNYSWAKFKEERTKELSVNILVMHLSFIEALKKPNTEDKYKENEIIDFIRNEIIDIKAIAEDKFILVITTGRGRYEWQEKLKKENSEYSQFTIFRPIESLLSAVEDAVSFKDDFQVKYNLVKAIFGS